MSDKLEQLEKTEKANFKEIKELIEKNFPEADIVVWVRTSVLSFEWMAGYKPSINHMLGKMRSELGFTWTHRIKGWIERFRK